MKMMRLTFALIVFAWASGQSLPKKSSANCSTSRSSLKPTSFNILGVSYTNAEVDYFPGNISFQVYGRSNLNVFVEHIVLEHGDWSLPRQTWTCCSKVTFETRVFDLMQRSHHESRLGLQEG